MPTRGRYSLTSAAVWPPRVISQCVLFVFFLQLAPQFQSCCSVFEQATVAQLRYVFLFFYFGLIKQSFTYSLISEDYTCDLWCPVTFPLMCFKWRYLCDLRSVLSTETERGVILPDLAWISKSVGFLYFFIPSALLTVLTGWIKSCRCNLLERLKGYVSIFTSCLSISLFLPESDNSSCVEGVSVWSRSVVE